MNDQASYPTTSTSTLAIASLVFGILTWAVLPFIGAVVAIVCGHLARSELRHAPSGSNLQGTGMALAGLILGYLHLAALLLLVMMFFGVLFLSIGSLWH